MENISALLKQSLVALYRKIDFSNEFNFFGLKIEWNIQDKNKNLNLDGKLDGKSDNDEKTSNVFYDKYEKNSNYKFDYIIVKDRNKEIFNLLVNLCMRKGNKKLAYKTVKKAFALLRKFFWIDSMFFIRLILVQSESLFIIQKYSFGKREKVIPRFIPFQKKTRFVLRMLVKHAISTQKDYKYFYISLVNAIIEYSMPDNVLIQKNREDNELAELNKFFLFRRRKRKRRKFRLFRKIDDWKE